MEISIQQQALLAGAGGEAAAMAMRILDAMARAEGAAGFIPVESVHVDGCLLHGASGVAFAEKLVALGARVSVPTSLNVGAMDLRDPSNVHLEEPKRSLAVRLMNAYVAMGCIPSWTCAPYQAGFRPAPGTHIAWAESNAVVFANSVLGARTNRYGDFMDICCALTGYAPNAGLHLDENRLATVRLDVREIPARTLQLDAFYPVLGAWLGRVAGGEVAVVDGLPAGVGEDQLKALGAAAASTGAVGLFHIVGVTPEAPTLQAALGGRAPKKNLVMTQEILLRERDRLSTARGERVDVIAVGSPHFSLDEFEQLLTLFAGRRSSLPFHACTGRHVYQALEQRGLLEPLARAGVRLVTDTCVVVTPVIHESSGVLMTNSGKFAHYSDALISHAVVFGSLADCVESAVAGRVLRDADGWGGRA
jgi:predicted aconitase